MKIKNVTEVHDFVAAANKCRGNVYLKSQNGDVYNLKSELSQYIALGALLGQHGDDLELFCDDRDDVNYFFKFFKEHPTVNA